MQVIRAVPELLHRLGCDHVFAMLGGSNVSWAAEGMRRGIINVVRTRHEETAVNAAVGYSRVTGRVGVCTVTRGPGFANAVNSLISAVDSHVPIVLIVGESPTINTRTVFTEQNVNQKGFAALIGAGFQHVEKPQDLQPALQAAFRAAAWKGHPQVVSINNALGDEDVELADDDGDGFAGQAHALPEPDAVEMIIDAIERSQRPLILAGQGAVVADARAELEQLADVIGADVTTSLRGNRFFAGHPRDLGLCGTWSAPVVRDRFAAADLVLAFGASLNPKTTYSDQIFAGARIVHCEIDLDQPFMASSPELALVGDAKHCAAALVRAWDARGLARREPQGSLAPTPDERTSSVLAADLAHDPARGMDVRVALAALDRKLPDDRIVVTDAGRTVGVAATVLGARDARSWIVGRGYGSTGLGLGMAIGAAVGQPDRPVVLFSGDIGFMMALSSLDTARLAELNLAIVILNDRQLGSEVKYLGRHGLPLDIIRQDLPDVVRLAEAFGGEGTVLETEADLEQFKFAQSGLQLVDLRIDPDLNGLAALS